MAITSTQNVQDAFAIYFPIVASFCAIIYSTPKEKLVLKL